MSVIPKSRQLSSDMRNLPLAIRRTPPAKLAIHGAVYKWAQDLVRGLVVLDLGCAEGFGTTILADSAKAVIGADWDADLIGEAERINSKNNIEYRTLDCQRLTFEPGTFDVIMNNALLEHVGNVDTMMAGATRSLRDDGLMICGTKNREFCLSGADGSPLYGNHVREFTAGTLEELLKRHFDNVEMFSLYMDGEAERLLGNSLALRIEEALVHLGIKEIIPRGLRNKVRRIVTGVDVEQLTSEQFSIEPRGAVASTREPHYLLALARRPHHNN